MTRRLDKAFDNIHFVVDRQLYRDARLGFQLCLGVRRFVFVLQIQINEVVSVNAINRENGQDRQIRNQYENIEGG